MKLSELPISFWIILAIVACIWVLHLVNRHKEKKKRDKL